MVAEARTWVDIESALRSWARDAVPSVDRRVFFGVNDRAAMPQIVLFRIFGPDDRALIQFDAWGDTKSQAASVGAELCTALDALSHTVYGDVILHGSRVDAVRWQPDEESDQPRYTIDAVVMASANS